VAEEADDFLAGPGIANSQAVIGIRESETGGIGTERKSNHIQGRNPRPRNQPSGFDIPEFHRSVSPRRRQSRPVWTERHAVNGEIDTFTEEHLILAGPGVPEPDGAVCRGRGEMGAVGTEVEIPDPIGMCLQ
jgi:hypothetical protein